MKDKYIEMVYKKENTREILDKGCYKGYKYVIISYGTHPCAYVKVPKGHKYYGVGYDDAKGINVHGGLTYCQDVLHFDMPIVIKLFGKVLFTITPKQRKSWWFGWDYAHCGDYIESVIEMPKMFARDYSKAKRWTVDEMRYDVKMAIAGLIREGRD